MRSYKTFENAKADFQTFPQDAKNVIANFTERLLKIEDRSSVVRAEFIKIVKRYKSFLNKKNDIVLFNDITSNNNKSSSNLEFNSNNKDELFNEVFDDLKNIF